eukprot:scaffold174749_cov17-Tisochrysis_lutea.AAC.1
MASLGLALEQREDVWTADYDSACAVLAVHTLLHVLGHMQFNSGDRSSSSSSSSTAGAGGSPGSRQTMVGQVITLEGPDANLVDGAVRVMVEAEAGMEQRQGSSAASAAVGGGGQAHTRETGGTALPGAPAEKETVYISLAAAARAVRVVLPAV